MGRQIIGSGSHSLPGYFLARLLVLGPACVGTERRRAGQGRAGQGGDEQREGASEREGDRQKGREWRCSGNGEPTERASARARNDDVGEVGLFHGSRAVAARTRLLSCGQAPSRTTQKGQKGQKGGALCSWHCQPQTHSTAASLHRRRIAAPAAARMPPTCTAAPLTRSTASNSIGTHKSAFIHVHSTSETISVTHAILSIPPTIPIHPILSARLPRNTHHQKDLPCHLLVCSLYSSPCVTSPSPPSRRRAAPFPRLPTSPPPSRNHKKETKSKNAAYPLASSFWSPTKKNPLSCVLHVAPYPVRCATRFLTDREEKKSGAGAYMSRQKMEKNRQTQKIQAAHTVPHCR